MYLHVSFEEAEVKTESDQPDDAELIKDVVLNNYTNTLNNSNIKRYFEKIILAKSEDDEIKASAYFDMLLYELSELSI